MLTLGDRRARLKKNKKKRARTHARTYLFLLGVHMPLLFCHACSNGHKPCRRNGNCKRFLRWLANQFLKKETRFVSFGGAVIESVGKRSRL